MQRVSDCCNGLFVCNRATNSIAAVMSSDQQQIGKWIPLESNPEVRYSSLCLHKLKIQQVMNTVCV